MIRTPELLEEAMLAARSRRASAVLLAVLTGAICMTILITQGRSHAATTSIMAQLDAAGSRVLSVSEAGNTELVEPQAVAALATADSVEAVAGLSIPRDLTNGAVASGGERVAAWHLSGDLRGVVTLADGRWPRNGEALVSVNQLPALGLEAPVGYVVDSDDLSYPVVGSFHARPGFDDLDGLLIYTPRARMASLRVVIASVDRVAATQRLALSLLQPNSSQQLRVESPSALAELQQAVGADLGAYATSVSIIAMASGTLLIAIIILSQILLQAADLGRRRALGANRSTIVSFILIKTWIPAFAGTVCGIYFSVIILGKQQANLPWTLPVAAGVLALCAASIAAIPPALIAAYRDPVRVLRTP